MVPITNDMTLPPETDRVWEAHLPKGLDFVISETDAVEKHHSFVALARK
jgi:hypothetical protein